MIGEKKYIIKNKKNNQFYNFITKSWVNNLTLACLTTASNVLKFSGKLEDIKIKKYIINKEIKEDIVDIVL